MTAPFNDYDANGYRINRHGNRSSRIEDEAIISNVRFAHREAVTHLSDAALINAYDDFFWSDMFGDNDIRFPEFVKDWE